MSNLDGWVAPENRKPGPYSLLRDALAERGDLVLPDVDLGFCNPKDVESLPLELKRLVPGAVDGVLAA